MTTPIIPWSPAKATELRLSNQSAKKLSACCGAGFLQAAKSRKLEVKSWGGEGGEGVEQGGTGLGHTWMAPRSEGRGGGELRGGRRRDYEEGGGSTC